MVDRKGKNKNAIKIVSDIVALTVTINIFVAAGMVNYLAIRLFAILYG